MSDDRMRLIRLRAEDPEKAVRGDDFHYEWAQCRGERDLLSRVVESLRVRTGQAFADKRDPVADELREMLDVYRTKLADADKLAALFMELDETCHTDEHWQDECPGDHGK